jgi:uncharacterized protein (DUF1501 family)
MAAALANMSLGCCPGSSRGHGKDAAVGTGGRAITHTRARACILLYMNGGPSQIDTFDPKPGSDTAGGVKAIGTAVAGLQFAEFLPQLAKQAGRLAVIRSLVSKEGNHARARHLMHTGYVPAGGVRHPAFGAISAAELSRGPLPGYVSINGPGAGAGFLGAAHDPFAVGNPTKPVRNIARAEGVSEDRFAERIQLWRELEDGFAAGRDAPLIKDHVSKEPEAHRAAYGEGRLGQGCLMARRLVEAGVPFVEVQQQGWDTHASNLDRVKLLGAELDRAMAALLADLAARGLLETTLVVWAGDFGRTPTINANGGRDHYPQVTPAVFAGGGVRGGQAIGATDARGIEVVDRRLSVPDLYASVAHALGIDPHKERMSTAGRPIATVDGGTIIGGLFG